MRRIVRVNVYLFAPSPHLSALPSRSLTGIFFFFIILFLFPPLCSDAVVLSTVCKPLCAAVAASKWPPYSPLPLIAPDGTVSEPVSGRFSITCRPEEGGEGVQHAIYDCPPAGSILLLEGVYNVTEPIGFAPSDSVHIFGRGRAELRSCTSNRHLLQSYSPLATFDRLRINIQSAELGALSITGGHFRLQGCDLSARVENDAPLLHASARRMSPAVCDALGCSFLSMGWGVVAFYDGASGRVEG